jgi:hypothetical protein
LAPAGPAGPTIADFALALNFAGVTASFCSCREPTLSLPSCEAAKAVPPPISRNRQRVEITFE